MGRSHAYMCICLLSRVLWMAGVGYSSMTRAIVERGEGGELGRVVSIEIDEMAQMPRKRYI